MAKIKTGNERKTWTVRFQDAETVYSGFDQKVDSNSEVVLVQVDGILEVWAVDDILGFQTLLKYLRNPNNRHGQTKVLGRFTPQQFLGVKCDESYDEILPWTGVGSTTTQLHTIYYTCDACTQNARAVHKLPAHMVAGFEDLGDDLIDLCHDCYMEVKKGNG